MAHGICENAVCFAIYRLPFHIRAAFFSGLLEAGDPTRYGGVRADHSNLLSTSNSPSIRTLNRSEVPTSPSRQLVFDVFPDDRVETRVGGEPESERAGGVERDGPGADDAFHAFFR